MRGTVYAKFGPTPAPEARSGGRCAWRYWPSGADSEPTNKICANPVWGRACDTYTPSTTEHYSHLTFGRL